MKAKLKKLQPKAKRFGYPVSDGSRTINGVRYEVDKVYEIDEMTFKTNLFIKLKNG